MKHTLKRQSDFQTIYSLRRFTDSKYFRVYKDSNKTSKPLTAIVASKKVGNAVTRNFLKRRVRHILQNTNHQTNCIVIIKTSAQHSEFSNLKDSLTKLLT